MQASASAGTQGTGSSTPAATPPLPTSPETRKAARRKVVRDLDKHRYHDQTVITVGGQLAAVDSDIAPLVETLEALDGVTVTHWQDHHDSMGRLLLEGPRAFEFLVAMALLGKEHGVDRFSVELGEKLAINGLERTYPVTLETAKQVARRSRP